MCSVRQLADAILPSLKLNAALPTCLLLFHTFALSAVLTLFSPLRFPSSSSCSVDLMSFYCLSVCFHSSSLSLSLFLIEQRGSTLQDFILFLSLHLFLSMHFFISIPSPLSLPPLCKSPPSLSGGKNSSSTSQILNRKRV